VGAPHSVRKKLLYMSTLFTKKSASLAAGVSAFVFALALVVPSASFAAGPSTLYVDPTASAVGQDGSSAHPFILIQDAVTAASAGDTIHISGKNTVTSKININVPLTITGYPSAEIDTTGSDYMFVINPGAAGTTISNLTLYKVDSVTDDAMVFVNANNVSITSNFIRGMYMIGDPNTSRGLVIANGVSGLYIFNNTFNSLRQPAYINNASGTVYHNTTQVTKGWVVVPESNITFTDNSWGTGPLANVVDIAIIPDSPAGANNYADVHAISLANHNAFVVNKAGATTQQSDVYVNDATGNDANDGSNLSPLKTIPAGLTRVVANGTVHVAAGTYAGPLTLTKSGVSLLGTAGVTVNETSNDSFGYGTTVDNASNVTISNITFVSAQTSGYALHGYHANGLALNNLTFTGPGSTGPSVGGVDINTSSNVTLNSVSVNGFHKNGFAVTSKYVSGDTAASGITFNNISSTNNGWNGIAFYTSNNAGTAAGNLTGVQFTGTNTISGNGTTGPTQGGVFVEGDSDTNLGLGHTPAYTVTSDGSTLDLTHVALSGNAPNDIFNYQTDGVNAIGTTFGGATGDSMDASARSAEDTKIYDKLDQPVLGLVNFYTPMPSVPVLTAPANSVVLPTNEFDFTWEASTGSTGITYEFQSSLDSAQTGGVLTNGLWQSGVLTSPMIHSSGAPDGTWYWQVRAKDAAGNYSAWSPIWSVTLDHTPVVIVPPATASVTTNDASNVSAADATLNATNGGVDADGHSIWVSTSSFSTASPTIPAGVYSTPDMGAVTAGASYSATLSSVTTDGVPSNLPALVPGTTYYYAAWVHANGAWIPGDIKTVTLTSSGDTGGDTLAKPVGTFPDNAATLTSAQLTHVTWTAVSDAHAPISYVYEVSASPTVKGDGSFQTPIDIGAAGNVTTNEVATGGTPEGTYYWHVRAVDSLNTTSAWSDTESYTISNTVVVTNHAPTAGDQTLSLTQDTSAPITLNGADADNDNLTYAIVTAPTHGQVSGALPQATYTPDAGYTGTDSFVYSVTDGIVTVPPTGTVSITVNPAAPVNHVPAGADQSVSVDENSSAVITLSGTDADAADASHLTYTIVTTPAHGSFSGTAPALTYSPTTDYVGTDSFTYTVSDGVSTSSPSTVSITVNTVVAPTTQQSEVSNTRGSSGQFASPQGSAPANNGGVSGQVAGASTYFFAKNFGYNSRGQDVIELQKILIAAGLLHVNAPTGWFGSQTKAALKLWQTSQAISATGYVGPLTRAALNTLTGVSSTTTH
jgi:hypothetical protein